MKKNVSILLAIVLVVTSVFTACSKTGSTATASAQPGTSGEVSIWWKGDTLAKSVLLQSIIDFTDVNPNTKINMLNPDGSDDVNKLKVAIAGNTAPDIVRLDHVYLTALGRSNNLLDLVPYGANNVKSKFFASAWGGVSYKDKVYGLPFDANTIAFIVNMDILGKAGVKSAPTTYEEMITAGNAVKASNQPGVNAYTAPFFNPGNKNWASFQYYFWLWRMGGEILSTDLKTATFNSDLGVQALQMVTDLAKKYGLADATKYQEGDFNNGLVGMMEMGCWAIGNYEVANKNRKANFTVNTMPILKAGVPGYSGLGLYALGVLSTSKAPQLAYNFTAFLTTSTKYQTGFCEASKLIPSLPGATIDTFYSSPEWKVFVDQLKLAKTRPGVACWADVDNAIADAIASVATGASNPKEALDAAAAKVNALLAKES